MEGPRPTPSSFRRCYFLGVFWPFSRPREPDANSSKSSSSRRSRSGFWYCSPIPPAALCGGRMPKIVPSHSAYTHTLLLVVVVVVAEDDKVVVERTKELLRRHLLSFLLLLLLFLSFLPLLPCCCFCYAPSREAKKALLPPSGSLSSSSSRYAKYGAQFMPEWFLLTRT